MDTFALHLEQAERPRYNLSRDFCATAVVELILLTAGEGPGDVHVAPY